MEECEIECVVEIICVEGECWCYGFGDDGYLRIEEG